MAATENSVEMKRKADDSQEKERGTDGDGDGEDADWVGPMPSEATKAKKRKGGVFRSELTTLWRSCKTSDVFSNKPFCLLLPLLVVFHQSSNLSVSTWTTSRQLPCMSGATCTET